MSENEKLVAVISPWEKLPALSKKDFRMESLPEEKRAMVWRDDLQTEQALSDELRRLGVNNFDVQTKKTTDWTSVQ